jgi:hypothetical protein
MHALLPVLAISTNQTFTKNRGENIYITFLAMRHENFTFSFCLRVGVFVFVFVFFNVSMVEV